MLKARETEIEMIVAVTTQGILAPCGRCRELLAQVNPANFSCQVALPGGTLTTLRELLPNHWTAGLASE
jgi:cytidine deaminase